MAIAAPFFMKMSRFKTGGWDSMAEAGAAAKTKEVRAQRELLVHTLQDRARLAYMRYNGGVSNLLEALDADRELFDAELSLAQARRDELLSVVALYKSLGGGWQA